MTRDLGRDARDNLGRLQAALRALWPDRPVVYFTESSGQNLGPGPVLTDEEQQQLSRVAEAIREGERRGAQLRDAVQTLADQWDAPGDARQAHNRIARSTAARVLRETLAAVEAEQQ